MKKRFPLIVFLGLFILLLAIVLTVPVSSDPDSQKRSLVTTLKNRFVTKDENPRTTVLLGGDVMLGRTVMTTSLDKNDFNYPFLQIAPVTRNADIFFVNLENPFVEGCRRDYESLIFCALPRMSQGLVFSGINVVTLANNHILNYGQKGLEQTKNILEEKNILYTGLGELRTMKKNGVTFGFLGFELISKTPTQADWNLIAQSNSKVDVLIVSVHWGREYQPEPDQIQRDWAQKMVKLGADVIVGHHPHWVQSSEKINGVFVYYSLGNLVFDQMWSKNTRSGLLVKLIFEGKELVSKEEIKTYMHSWAQPEIVREW